MKARSFSILKFFLVVSAAVAHGHSLKAQKTLAEDTLDLIPGEQDERFGFRNGSLIAVPIPFSDPTVGNGLALGAGWLFSSDTSSNSSSIGLGGFQSDNGSEGLAFGMNLNTNANRYRLSFLAGSVDLNYDFEAGAFDFPLEQSGELYKIDASYGFSEDFSLGLGLRYAETTVKTDFGGILPPEVSAALDLEILKFGIIADWDTRDSDIYPTTGSRVTLDMFRGEVAEGFVRDYSKAVAKGAMYRQVAENGVVAIQATLCGASDDAPFFDACTIGLTDGMRGFSAAKYIGDSLLSGQVEYRGRIRDSRVGYVAFAAAGAVGATGTSESGAHATAGVGIRYRLSKNFPVDFSIDATINSDDEKLYYIFVGQSF